MLSSPAWPGPFLPRSEKGARNDVGTKKTQVKPKPGAPDWPVRNLRLVAREDVTERELEILGIVRHFAALGFDLRTYSSMIFGGEEQCRSPEDRIAGRLAPIRPETFDRLLNDGVNFVSLPRLMSMFMVLFQGQDEKRRTQWKRKFFAGWDPADEKGRSRHIRAAVVFNMYRGRMAGSGLKARRSERVMAEIQETLDRLAAGGEAHTEEEKSLKKFAIPGERRVTVQALLDEARGALGLRTRPRLKRNRRQIP